MEKGPFIVVSGHDLHDLKLLLEQTEGRGVNVYTHGEMLPAHGYPELKKYAHLKGNFGTAWQNQQKEFAEHSCAGALHHQLPDAAEGQLRGPRIHHVSRDLTRNYGHIGEEKGLHACH